MLGYLILTGTIRAVALVAGGPSVGDPLVSLQVEPRRKMRLEWRVDASAR